ncbi:MAG: hypothetical protein JW863_01175 [Chitinispirillaceae bacterium]|nr:hypothetical protein [Chitinispirillaceae bacterium]
MFAGLFFVILFVGTLQAGKCGTADVKQSVSDSQVKIYRYGDLTVIEKSYKSSSAKDIFVVRTDSTEATTKVTKDTLFLLLNQENGFFIKLIKTFLFMDYGTGPDARTLSAYDINSGNKILDTLYWDTISVVGVDTVSIWMENGDSAVSKCPQYEEWLAGGLGAVIIKEHYFNLRKLELHKTKKFKCVPLQ